MKTKFEKMYDSIHSYVNKMETAAIMQSKVSMGETNQSYMNGYKHSVTTNDLVSIGLTAKQIKQLHELMDNRINSVSNKLAGV